MEILDTYVLKKPAHQNVLDIFKGEWSSRLPDRLGLVTEPGTARLFEDARVDWAEQALGGFADWNILELGPLEGGHSYMFQNKNAAQVIAIEANTRAFLKCLCIKEILKLDRVSYELGDFMAFLENDHSHYDLVFASGVLYHMEEPVRLLDLISRVTDRLFLWTHYYDPEVMSQRKFRNKFSHVQTLEYAGVCYDSASQAYGNALSWAGFCGGPKSSSKWLTRDSIIKALNEFRFSSLQFNFEQPDHPNGPAFAICAHK